MFWRRRTKAEKLGQQALGCGVLLILLVIYMLTH